MTLAATEATAGALPSKKSNVCPRYRDASQAQPCAPADNHMTCSRAEANARNAIWSPSSGLSGDAAGAHELPATPGQADMEPVGGLMSRATANTSIAHEVGQSITAIVCNAQAALRWLDPRQPNLREARLALGRIAESGEHAGEIVTLSRNFLKKEASHKRPLKANEAIDAIALSPETVSSDGMSATRQVAASARHGCDDCEFGAKLSDACPVRRVDETRLPRAMAHDAPRDRTAAPTAFPQQELQRARVTSFIEKRLDDPDLSIDCIARSCNMSVRSLHRAFATDPASSVSRYIWMRRVDHCAADLRDLSQVHRPITDICFSWGFNSTSHFSRLFKEQLGMTPRDYRAAFMPSGEGWDSTSHFDLSSSSTTAHDEHQDAA